ncbi:hypothetical protein OGAPHI_005276 [Ogataea philodendri]|uniref:PCI domain-containing protein n=1 Tax=Ogataea philodendri TaxID=1378263 RepID=A0A9P8T2I3_9ASCO|nr:uncharacterized protein OGAPHI_005276 [Ogataea philodendri]KAH3663873.1 hypothetical protein OGAPHI_005276 [Ogataea philodendri]
MGVLVYGCSNLGCYYWHSEYSNSGSIWSVLESLIGDCEWFELNTFRALKFGINGDDKSLGPISFLNIGFWSVLKLDALVCSSLSHFSLSLFRFSMNAFPRFNRSLVWMLLLRLLVKVLIVLLNWAIGSWAANLSGLAAKFMMDCFLAGFFGARFCCLWVSLRHLDSRSLMSASTLSSSSFSSSDLRCLAANWNITSFSSVCFSVSSNSSSFSSIGIVSMTYLEYLTQLRGAVYAHNSVHVASAFSFLLKPEILQKKADYYTFLLSLPPENMLSMPGSDQQDQLDHWSDLVRAYVLVIKSFLVDSDLESAIEQSINMVQSMVRIAQKQDSWICLPLMTVTSELRQLACMYLNMKKGPVTLKNDTLPLDERLVDVLQKPFKTCLTDKSDTLQRSKKLYVYFFANEVLKCYFKFGKYEAASNLSKVLAKAPNLPNLDQSPKAHVVNFHYYNGLVCCMNDDLESVNKHLTAALKTCPKESLKQQQLILLILLPVKFLVEKRLPGTQIWKRYPQLGVFEEIFRALKIGHLGLFDTELAKLQSLLLKKKVYSVYLRIRPFVELKLTRQVVSIEQSHQLKLEALHRAFEISAGRKYSLDEVESRLANLVAQGLAKGYISHSNRVAVLSKKEAFPKLVSQFKLEGDTINDIVSNARTRAIGWDSCVRADYLTVEEADCLKKVADFTDVHEKTSYILKNADFYSTKIVSLLSKAPHDDIVRFVLVSLIDTLVAPKSNFAKNILSISHLDSSLPYGPLVKLVGSNDESIKLSSAYVLTLLLTDDGETHDGQEKILKPLFEFLSVKLLSSTKLDLNFLSVQLLKELLSIKQYRQYFWAYHETFFPPLLKVFSERRGELQMKYYATMSIWLLTFIPQALKDIETQYTELIATLYSVARDAVKEKIVRLSVSSLLNLLSVETGREQLVKQFLLVKGLETTKQLIERKWADEELKSDLETLLSILNEAVTTLTTFDEFENELNTGKLNWSPSHKSEEFWIENADKFKENNWRILKQLVALLGETSDPEQTFLNQAIVCFDVSQLIKVLPEVVKVLDKTGAKAEIMTLMSSANTNVKFEALRTTQKLVAHSL